MGETVIVLDEGRELCIQAPQGDYGFWVFLLDKAGYRKDNRLPGNFCRVRARETPEAIASESLSWLYNCVRRSWLDENWNSKIKPQILAFVKEATQQKEV